MSEKIQVTCNCSVNVAYVSGVIQNKYSEALTTGFEIFGGIQSDTTIWHFLPNGWETANVHKKFVFV